MMNFRCGMYVLTFGAAVVGIQATTASATTLRLGEAVRVEPDVTTTVELELVDARAVLRWAADGPQSQTTWLTTDFHPPFVGPLPANPRDLPTHPWQLRRHGDYHTHQGMPVDVSFDVVLSAALPLYTSVAPSTGGTLTLERSNDERPFIVVDADPVSRCVTATTAAKAFYLGTYGKDIRVDAQASEAVRVDVLDQNYAVVDSRNIVPVSEGGHSSSWIHHESGFSGYLVIRAREGIEVCTRVAQNPHRQFVEERGRID